MATASTTNVRCVMSGSPVLLDSVVLIDHFNGLVEATSYLASVQSEAHVSAITRAEVLTGFSERRERRVARKLLEVFRFVSLDEAVADLAADLRREEGWKLPDAFQAAAALHHNLKLATRNTRDFSPQRHDFVVIPYTLAG